MGRLMEALLTSRLLRAGEQAAGAGLSALDAAAEAASAGDEDPHARLHLEYESREAVSGFHVLNRTGGAPQGAGAVLYLDGDYRHRGLSRFHHPTWGSLPALAEVAGRHGMVLVALDSPHRQDGEVTWWRDRAANGRWFREASRHVTRSLQLDPARLWTMGYSGGAELIGAELAAREQSSWKRGGGHIMVGGGSCHAVRTDPPECIRDAPMHWFAGDRDVAGTTDSVNWSALGSARQGRATYAAAGYTNTHLHILPGVTHVRYDLPALLEEALSA